MPETEYTDEELNRLAQRLAIGEAHERPNGTLEIRFDELVARDSHRTYIFLDYLFTSSSSDLAGATGTRMVPVSEEEFEERKEKFYDPEWSPIRHIYDEENTTESWEEWINDIPEWEIEEMVLDPSYQSKFGPVVVEKAGEEFDMDIDEWLVECIGGGRMFGTENEYEHVYREDLLELIEFVEAHGLQPLLDRYEG